MSLPERIEMAVQESLAENNVAIVKFEPAYETARDFVARYGTQKLAECEGNMPDKDLMALVRDAAETKKKAVMEKLKKMGLTLEIVLNRGEGGVELFMPVRYANGTVLEKDLTGHATAAFYEHDPEAATGKFGEYLALFSDDTDTRALRRRLKAVPEAMELANIDVAVLPMALPIEGAYGEAESIEVRMTQSAVGYRLIPVRKRHSSFFPPDKRLFEIVTEHGTVQARVTSIKPDGKGGNYICSRGDGSMGRVIESMQLKPGDSVLITALVPKKKYSMARI